MQASLSDEIRNECTIMKLSQMLSIKVKDYMIRRSAVWGSVNDCIVDN